MAQNTSLGVREAVNLSKKMMLGHKKRLFFLHLSFIGWFLLAVIPLMIVSLFFIDQIGLIAYLSPFFILIVYPYIISSEAAFYLDLQYHYKKEVLNQEIANSQSELINEQNGQTHIEQLANHDEEKN